MYLSTTPNFLAHCLFMLLTISHVTAVPITEGDNEPTSVRPRDSASTPNPLGYAPDTSKDPFPPYPPMRADDGKNITVENLRGVRLYGWTGCSSPDVKTITESFDDFEKLAKQEALWKIIDWDSPAARDIWGHGTGNKAVTDERKKQIQQIFQAVEQVRDKAWWQPPYDDFVPPWIAWRYLWIEIACSSVKGDPNNDCGDRPPKDPTCPGGRDPPAGGMGSEMEAFSNPLGKYSKITFCEHFFLRMESLGTIINEAKSELSPAEKNDLWSYQNRARTVFHEITHLNYFMNAPDKSPYVDDLEIPFGPKSRRTYYAGYGPERIKNIANYEAVNKGGFYTQRNADSYAWFAVSKYVEQEVGQYPSDPVVNQRPAAAPRDGDKKEFATSSETEEGNNADTEGTEPPLVTTTSDKHWVPGCPDHAKVLSETFGVSSVGTSQVSITCDDKQISGLPYNVFHGTAGNVYDKFCFNLDSTVSQEWIVNTHGDQKSNEPKRIRRVDALLKGLRLPFFSNDAQEKRTPPPNPNSYDDYSIDLKWETNKNTLGCGQNLDSCRQVFASVSNSPCGHQAGEQNIMASVGKAEVKGCGTYSWNITSPNSSSTPTSTPTPAPTSTPANPDMSSKECTECSTNMGASSCKADDPKCLVDQCKADTNCQACKIDCNTFVQ